MDNARIADHLDAFATLLELAEANSYQPRAYRRAAETIRASPVPIEELVRAGRVRELRGIGPGIEARLRELVETGEIAELRELERELVPGLVGLGRFLGLTTKRSVEIARALGVRTPEEFRAAVAAGRLRAVPGVGPKTEARVRGGARARATPTQPGLLLDRARALVGAIASALDGEAGGRRAPVARRVRAARGGLRGRRSGVGAGPLRGAAADRRGDRARGRRARGLTVEGVPVDLVVAAPERFGTELVRATGSAAYVAALEPLPDAPSEAGVYAALGLPWVPPELREAPFRGEPPALVSEQDIRGDLHCHTTWSDGRFSVEEMGRAARERGYEYVAICDHTPAVGAVRGLTADDVRRQGEEIAAANERLAPFRILRGIECDILPDGRLDLPDDVLAELDWVQASVHGGQRMPRARADPARARRRCATPRCAASAIRRAGSSAAGPRTRSTSSACSRSRASTASRSRSTASPPRLDLSGEHVREALRAGVRIVCSTDAHSVRGLANMPLSVHTARRGGATRADVLNAHPLEALLAAGRQAAAWVLGARRCWVVS